MINARIFADFIRTGQTRAQIEISCEHDDARSLVAALVVYNTDMQKVINYPMPRCDNAECVTITSALAQALLPWIRHIKISSSVPYGMNLNGIYDMTMREYIDSLGFTNVLCTHL